MKWVTNGFCVGLCVVFFILSLSGCLNKADPINTSIQASDTATATEQAAPAENTVKDNIFLIVNGDVSERSLAALQSLDISLLQELPASTWEGSFQTEDGDTEESEGKLTALTRWQKVVFVMKPWGDLSQEGGTEASATMSNVAELVAEAQQQIEAVTQAVLTLQAALQAMLESVPSMQDGTGGGVDSSGMDIAIPVSD